MKLHAHDRGVIARYHAHLPVSDATPVISLNEGTTPLIYSPRLSELTNRHVYLKFEGLNPTGSFKDRGMTMAVSKAAEEGAHTLVCASTGNTSAAAAAYASRAGLRCVVILPAGKISMGKLAQAFVYGAQVVAIRGNFDRALELVVELAADGSVSVVNSINPYRIEGQKTASFEVIDELGDAPDLHILPVGNAGNITAYWKGYREYRHLGKSTKLPRMLGFQAAGSAPIFHQKIVDSPETQATAIRIGNPASWQGATDAIAQSHGGIDIVTDEEILAAQSWLAKNEGVFVEPASAASVAGLMKCACERRCATCPLPHTNEGDTIVCTVTGHGLKDSDTAVKFGGYAPTETDADLDSVRRALRA